ncbi:acyl-CoA dehydrogenase family protein [Mycobacterium sp. SMC-4]|uniref:acyl-CoA dehydrogenase family protein n=1 Tax=Mycobacterium sp. SMC-4 TaxID=2857059 RepID=UPI0021B29841|nr:acyl-CoA dehydrogenase family protein [Mycobacterium sp. SMC-4]UXA20084.1 acyl-CoA/acyl-ACP dehydrogenase [Mycobacterium sp. SMC-4]
MVTEDELAVDLDLVRESARDFLSGRGDKDTVDDLAAMDWTSLLVEEASGGAGWRPVEAAVVAEELGRSGDRSAWLGVTVAAAALDTAPETTRERWLGPLMAGSVVAGVAVAGSVARVIRGERADLLITLGPGGVELAELGEGQQGRADDDLLDVARPVWRIDTAELVSTTIGSPERADLLLALSRLLLSADSVGTVSTTFARLTEYLRDRTAFGAPIASFQAVQHRLVEILVFEVKARAAVMKAARTAAAGAGAETAKAAAVAHAFVAGGATAAIDECMQLSGGIGFTWEYPLHNELRRVFTNAQLLGTARSTRAHLAEAAGW